MSGLSILMIGGSGIISAAVAHEVVALGHTLTLVNRGRSPRRLPAAAELLIGDVRDAESVRGLIGERRFDVVVDWLAFDADDIERGIALFSERVAQFVFISSASAYQTPPSSLPIRESTPLRNPFWQYSRNKIAAEERLLREYRESGFPATIVRPSHTYDETMPPFDGGWTVVDRMRRGLPVVVPGDGSSLWTITHSRDFAWGFARLLGLPQAVGQTFHITNEQPMPWNEIYLTVARAAGVPEPELIHVASEAVALADPEWGAALLGDKSHSMVFDNAKIRAFVPGFEPRIPFWVGAQEIVAWFDADPARRSIDPRMNDVMDRLINAYRPRPV